MFQPEEELKKLPQTPGVYLHKDQLGNVIYVGKAIKLRSRVSQYFHRSAQHTAKVRAMVENIAEFDYITCATEMEALLLECNLIKKYLPKYNILLKDGKTYPYIEVTTTEPFPRVIRTREVRRDGNRYFGPYSDSGAVRRIIRLIDEIYPIKKCRTRVFPENVRPCLNYFIGKCKGICINEADPEEYAEMIARILDILSGKDGGLVRELEKKMQEASEQLRYEEAARYRDDIAAFRALSETQRVAMAADRDVDVLIPVMTEQNRIVAQYKVRDGKMVGREIHYLEGVESTETEELLSAFLKQHYTGSAKLPREILLPRELSEAALLTELLNRVNAENAAGKQDVLHKTKIRVPERGAKRAVLEMAIADSLALVKSLDERAARDADKRNALRDKLTELIERACAPTGAIPCTLEEDEREYRVEAYDISNLGGLDAVGAMVVYEGRKALRSAYRKFRIKTEAAEGDDYASLQEVIYRRLKRAGSGDPGFSDYPDLMMIDGGVGQVRAVRKVIDAMRMAIPVVGLAKDDAHRTRAVVFEDGSEIDLKADPLLFSYAGTVQEEVHRFAVTFQRGVRGRRMTQSVLEEIPGVGEKRRRELLRAFRSVENIRNASYEELLAVPGINARVAESIRDYFETAK